MLIRAILSIVTLAYAGPFSSPEMESEIRSDIGRVCINSRAQRKSAATCECVATNYMKVLNGEDKLESALKQVDWIKKLYMRELTQTEYEKDSHALTELTGFIHSECARDSKFRLETGD